MSDSPIVWSGKTASYHHKWNDTPNPPDVKPGIEKVWFLEAQWTDCPDEVVTEVVKIWQWAELGNDDYFYKTTLGGLIGLNGSEEYQFRGSPLSTKAILQYIGEKCPGIKPEDQVIIHYWW